MQAHPAHHRQDPVLLDTLLAVGLTAFVWVHLATPRILFGRGGGPGPGFGQVPPSMEPFIVRAFVPDPLTFALAALCLLPLALRRVYPLATLATVTVAAALFDLLPHPAVATVLGPLIALYTVGSLKDRRTTLVAGGLAVALLLSVTLPSTQDPRWLAELVTTIAFFGAAAALGDATRNRRAYIAEVERRAAEAEARAEEEALRRVDEERLRIARELHDITAHSMSVIAVQSGVAEHVIGTDPEAARRALGDIRRTSKEALQELRSVLGVIREGTTAAPLAPTPGLERLPELARPLEEAGWRLDVRAEDLPALPQLVESSAYRIVQEALTNALRHAEPAEAAVSVRADGETLEVEVVNAGVRELPGRPAGHGVAGMRERAVALGGTFEAGLQPDGRWQVAASLPLNGRQ